MSKNKLESLNVNAIITATSDKQSDTFVSKDPRKSLYFTVENDEAQKLKAFGMQEYTPNDPEGKPYFIVQSASKISLYNAQKEKYADISGQTFGALSVIQRTGIDSGGNALYLCHCNLCGTDKEFPATTIYLKGAGS